MSSKITLFLGALEFYRCQPFLFLDVQPELQSATFVAKFVQHQCSALTVTHERVIP